MAAGYESTSGVDPDAYKVLESPYDEGKLDSLKKYGFDRVKLVKNDDGLLVLENYDSKNGRISALVKRNAEYGKVINISIDLNTRQGHTRELWSIRDQTFTSCVAGSKTGCKKTVIKACQTQNAKYDNYLSDICTFLAEVVLPPRGSEPSPTPSGSVMPQPSPSASPHMHLIFKH
jgi:hypothetical protein